MKRFHHILTSCDFYCGDCSKAFYRFAEKPPLNIWWRRSTFQLRGGRRWPSKRWGWKSLEVDCIKHLHTLRAAAEDTIVSKSNLLQTRTRALTYRFSFLTTGVVLQYDSSKHIQQGLVWCHFCDVYVNVLWLWLLLESKSKSSSVSRNNKIFLCYGMNHVFIICSIQWVHGW